MKAFCTYCKEETIPSIQDDGIGSYEFWGSRGFQSIKFIVSSCCESYCVNEYGKEIELKDYKQIIDYYR